MTATFEKPGPTPLDAALALREDGDLRGAVALLLRAAGDGLNDVEVVLTLAKMLAESDQLEQAERWFNRALALAPDDLAVQLAWGTFLGQAGRLDASRALLAKVGHAARDRLAEALSEGEQQALGHILSFLGSTEVNLARACLEAGDTYAARALVLPWLADPEHWGWAHAVYEDVVAETGGDLLQAARDGLSDGQASPPMGMALVAARLQESPPDFGGLDAVLARADAMFTFDWRHADPAVTAGLAEARRAYGRAVMRGEIVRETCRHLDAPSRRPFLVELAGDPHGLLAPLRGATEAVHPHVAWRTDPDADLSLALQRVREGGFAEAARGLVAASFRSWWQAIAGRLASGEDVASARLPYFYAPGAAAALAAGRGGEAWPPARALSDGCYDSACATVLAALEDAAILAHIAPWLDPAVDRFVASCAEADVATIAEGLRELWRLPQGEYVFAADGADGLRWPVSYPDHGRVGDLLDALADREAADDAAIVVWRATGAALGDDEVAWFAEVAEAELRDALTLDAPDSTRRAVIERRGAAALRVSVRLA